MNGLCSFSVAQLVEYLALSLTAVWVSVVVWIQSTAQEFSNAVGTVPFPPKKNNGFPLLQ